MKKTKIKRELKLSIWHGFLHQLIQIHIVTSVPCVCLLDGIQPAGIYCKSQIYDTLRPRQNSRHVSEDILELISLYKRLIKISLTLTIRQAWFRFRRGLRAEQATIHYFNQWWFSLLAQICATRSQWIFSKHRYDSYEITNPNKMQICTTLVHHKF